MTIKKLIIENFKGIVKKEYTFGILTKIRGMNRLGKTTIATAWYWLTGDKDYDLSSNPNIRPIDETDCIPTVTAVLDVNGKEVTITKMQKRKVGKPDENGISKISLTNTYEVNSVPKSERDYKAYLEDLGVSFDNFLACSHPKVFTSQKQADMRKILFKMASAKSDYDIASISVETEDVRKLLADYTMEEISAMQKSSKKKAIEQVAAIPNQIIGMESAKVDFDAAELELAKKSIEKELDVVKAKISNSSSVVAELQSKKMKLQFDINGLYQKAKSDLDNSRYEIDSKVFKAGTELENAKHKLSQAESLITEKKYLLSASERKKNELAEQWKAEKSEKFVLDEKYLFDESKWIFNESDAVCSMCGQKLPTEKVEMLITNFSEMKLKLKKEAADREKNMRIIFENSKKANLEKISENGMKQKEIIVEYEKQIKQLEDELPALVENVKANEINLVAMQEKLNAIPKEPDMSNCHEYEKLIKEDAEIQKQINDAENTDVLTDQLENEKVSLEQQLDFIKAKLSQVENNVRIDDQISDLKRKQLYYEQVKADADKILYQIDLVSKRKNELLTEEINGHFNIVKWKMFDYLKNGEYKECCIPVIDGKEYGVSTNTGREIQAELDICYSLQKFFEMYVPVFLDGAESLNEQYFPKSDDTQLITLSVSEDSEIKLEV